MTSDKSRRTFFRQSGWMVLAATLSGFFMFAVHIFNNRIPKSEYGVFGALLSLLVLTQIPTIGMQTVFARQTASAVSEEERRRLAGTVRGVVWGMFFIWLVLAAVAGIWHREILATFKISNSAALWFTLALALISLWTPIFQGVLQGLQNFFWMGWSSILAGVGRFSCVAILVLVLKKYAAGMMLAALCGALPSLAIGLWFTRSVWLGKTEKVQWNPWLRDVVPLTVGMGASQFLFALDIPIVQALFPEGMTGAYVAAATVGRALVMFLAPLAQVMFPKLVGSFVRSEKSDVLMLTFLWTALLGICAALGLTFCIRPVFQVVFPKYLEITPLIGLYGWCVLPQALGNVLLGNLLARNQFKSVGWLAVVAAGYGTALVFFHDSFSMVIKTMGVFSLLFFGVAAFFTWWKK